MTERIRTNSELGTWVQYNVRVGDRLGTVYEGPGSSINVQEELDKSERLGASTFKAIYGRSVNEYGEIVFKITPDGESLMLMRNRYGVIIPQRGKVPDVLTVPVSRNPFLDIDQIVVVPNGAFQTPEYLSLLPESDIVEHFEELNAPFAETQ